MLTEITEDPINYLFYHVTGVFFKYNVKKADKDAFLTHAIVPVNCDDLFTTDLINYTNGQKQWMWPYFILNRIYDSNKSVKDKFKVYQMCESTSFYLGEYDAKIINNEKLFLHVVFPMIK